MPQHNLKKNSLFYLPISPRTYNKFYFFSVATSNSFYFYRKWVVIFYFIFTYKKNSPNIKIWESQKKNTEISLGNNNSRTAISATFFTSQYDRRVIYIYVYIYSKRFTMGDTNSTKDAIKKMNFFSVKTQKNYLRSFNLQQIEFNGDRKYSWDTH